MAELKNGLAAITLEDLGKLNGGQLGVWFEMEVARIRKDAECRPNHKGKRSVTIKLFAESIPEDDGVYGAFITVECSSTLPKIKSTPTKVKFSRHHPGMVFQPEFPDNPDQMPLPFDNEHKEG